MSTQETTTSHLDRLANKALLALTQEEEGDINEELYAETGIGFGHEHFDDFGLVIHDTHGSSDKYLWWPIPGLRTVSEAVALARALKKAATPKG